MAATKGVLLKFDEGLLADVDRVRGSRPRAVWIKELCAAAVLAAGVLEEAPSEAEGTTGFEQAAPVPVGSVEPVRAAASPRVSRSKAEVSAITGHFAGCGCHRCDSEGGLA